MIRPNIKLQKRLFGAIYHRLNTFSKAGITNAEIIAILDILKNHYIKTSHFDFTDAFIKSEIRGAMKRNYKLVPIKKKSVATNGNT